VKNASEVTVDGNGDNSVSTNDFDVSNGANCITVATSFITTQASNAEVGGNIHDDATIGGSGLTTGTIHFEAFGPFPAGTSPTCTGTPAFTSDVTTNGTTGNPYSSGNYQTTGAGLYFWTAHYTDNNPLILQADSPCGAQNETSTVAKKSPTLTTDAGGNRTLDAQNPSVDLRDTATLMGGFNPTGSITYLLYRGATCNAQTLVATLSIDGTFGPPNPGDGLVHGNGSYVSQKHTTNVAGNYHWIANYSGDNNNNPTTNVCNGTGEDIRVFKPAITIDKTTTSINVHDGDSVTYHFVVTNSGPDALENVAVTDSLYSSCNRTTAQLLTLITAQGNHDNLLDTGESISYDCTVPISHASEDASHNVTNTATVTGNAKDDGTVSDTDDATVHVIHPAILITKTVCVTQAAQAFPRSVPVCAGANDPPLVVHVGDQLTYHIKVKNTGDSNLTDVAITDATLPGCNSEPNHHIGTLTPSQELEYDCTPFVVDAQTGDLHNVAHATGNDTADTPQSHEDSNDVDINAIHPAIKITKTACRTGGTNPAPSNPPVCAPDGGTLTVHVGDKVTYHFLIENKGDVTLTNVTLADDKFPACNTTIPSLPVNGNQDVTCEVTITANDGDPIHNTATATGTDPIGGTTSDDDDATTDVIHPAIDVTKTIDNDHPLVGTTATFTITVTNIGDVDLTNIVITDAQAANCARNPLNDGADGLGGSPVTLAKASNPANPASTFTYHCTKTVLSTDTHNAAHACGDDTIGGTTCDDTDVPYTPQKRTPDLPTQASGTIVVGNGTLKDTATLGDCTDPNAAICPYQPTGTITFTLYGPDDASCATVIFTSTVPVNNGVGPYTSDEYTPTQAGKYRWIATYDGDDNNNGVNNGCNGDNEDVIVQPNNSSIVTAQSLLPNDSATVTGGSVQPTGTVTFELFDNPNCTGTSLYTQDDLLTGVANTLSATAHTTNGNNPNAFFLAQGDGTWYWKVSYPGDANNKAVTSCKENFSIDNDGTVFSP
jgi:uncharacterized repeat protein (TIGR01451 family)